VALRFTDSFSDRSPSAFLVSVPRFYPHVPPSVYCMDHGLFECSYFRVDGRVLHPMLHDEWRPVFTVRDVLGWLHAIRVCSVYIQMCLCRLLCFHRPTCFAVAILPSAGRGGRVPNAGGVVGRRVFSAAVRLYVYLCGLFGYKCETTASLG
jgi:hypothetical protein